MTDKHRCLAAALSAYLHLDKVVREVSIDPHHPTAEQRLSDAAYAVNHAMADLGLVERVERPE